MYIFEVPTVTLRDAVFLMPIQLEGFGSLLVLVSSVSCVGSQKITLFAVFLWPLGEGGASAMWSTLDVAAKLGTSNAMIPNLSNVV